MRLILLGGPGSGKGTQGAVLAQRYSIPTISTGDLFRKNIADKTALGQKVKQYTDQGLLVPDEVVLDMVFDRLVEADCAPGYMLDGFPRTIPQADALTKWLSDRKTAIDHVVLIDVDDDVIVDRLSSRRTCESCKAISSVKFSPPKKEGVCDKCGGTLVQRADDNADTIRDRLQVYHKNTEPLIAYYRKQGILLAVDGSQAPEAVTNAITASIGV
jgi:adenylate kinase